MHHHAPYAARLAYQGLTCAGALLLPLMAVPESHIQTGAAGVPVSAAAHVSFKIVIPQVLSLRTGLGEDHGEKAQTVAIMSNGRSVAFRASVGAHDDFHAHQGVIVSAPAKKIIAQDAECSPRTAHAAAAPDDASNAANGDAHSLVCTVSMP
jgi:hypothetical protein